MFIKLNLNVIEMLKDHLYMFVSSLPNLFLGITFLGI